jgi:hypothetical protein
MTPKERRGSSFNVLPRLWYDRLGHKFFTTSAGPSLTPRGTYQVHTTGYSPAAAAIAQSNANVQNAEMISATIERGQANMAMLERAVIKDISCRVNGMAASFTLRHWFLRMGRSPTP